MGSRTVHLCVNIEGLLRRRSLGGLVINDDGRRCTYKEAKAWLLEQKAMGRRVLPFGDPCEGFDYQTGCPGHPVIDLPGDPFDFARAGGDTKEGAAPTDSTGGRG